MKAAITIRPAVVEDLPALIDLETRGFKTDNFSPEQFRYLLTKANCTILLLEYKRSLAGMAILLWRKRCTVARLYSIVVDPNMRDKGLGAILLQACEEEVSGKQYKKLSLEVRVDNKRAIEFYKYHGYKITENLPGYYSGRTSGFRMVKTLRNMKFKAVKLNVPYYGQTLEFTCGPACLLMALKYFKPQMRMERTLELQLWREATLIYTTAGFGGTGPFGLALAARDRNFPVKVVMSTKLTPFFSSVRTPEKQQVIKLAHKDYKQKALAKGVVAEYYDFTVDDIAREMNNGRLAIVLISTYHLHGDRAPHWVLITGVDHEYIYFHDPYEKFYKKNPKQPKNIKIPIDDFRIMRRYGKDLYKCAIFIGAPNK